MMGNWDFGFGFGTFGMLLGFLVMVAFWVLVLWGLIALIRWLMREGTVQKSPSAMDTLRERYAQGAISKEEFELKKKDINS